MVFDDTVPKYGSKRFVKCDWSEFYPDAAEAIPTYKPQPRGKEVFMSCFVDADHAGCRETKSAMSKIERTARLGAITGRLPYKADLLTLIKSLIRDIRRKISFNWIKGHQDNCRPYSTLPQSVQINIDADFLATRYRVRGKLRPSPRVEHIPAQRISTSINGVQVSSQYDDCIRYHVNGYHLRRYMQDKKKWPDKTRDDIDFDLFGTHFRSLTATQQIDQMKVVHDQLPLGCIHYRRSPVPSSSPRFCPPEGVFCLLFYFMLSLNINVSTIS
jgi:hypothetical protein